MPKSPIGIPSYTKPKQVPLWIFITICFAWITTSFSLYYFFHNANKTPANNKNEHPSESRINAQFPFLNPNLENSNINYVQPFREEVAEYIKKCQAEGKVNAVSVYFRGLNDGYMFGINDHENFHPASLMKVPELLAYLKYEQDSPGVLNKKFTYRHFQIDVPNNIPKSLQIGQQYTIKELLKQMIEYSDNDATVILDANIPTKFIAKVYEDFNIKMAVKFSSDADYLCVADYMRFFRVLYNASYLTKEQSNFALEILSQVYFKDGIEAGCPGIHVAHKYGQWFSNSENQLHDCGLVYCGGKPYLLGIMTKGKNVYTLAGVIQGISNIIYSNMQKGT